MILLEIILHCIGYRIRMIMLDTVLVPRNVLPDTTSCSSFSFSSFSSFSFSSSFAINWSFSLLPVTWSCNWIRKCSKFALLWFGSDHFWCNFEKILSLWRFEINHRRVFVDHRHSNNSKSGQDQGGERSRILKYFQLTNGLQLSFPQSGASPVILLLS